MNFLKFFALLLIILSISFYRAYPIMKIELHKPDKNDKFIELLNKRESNRKYSNVPLNMKQLSYILYASDARSPKGNRTAPSAGALYPIDIFVYANNVVGLSKGIYFYNPRYHYLESVKSGDFSHNLRTACYYQNFVKDAAVVLIFIYEKRRMEYKYKERALYYAYVEAGHISQNALLAVTKLGLAGVPIGAFDQGEILKLFGYKLKKRVPLYVNLVGNKK